MSIKSGSRSATQPSQMFRPSMLRTPRVESGLRRSGSSIGSLLWPRGSAAFRVGKSGYKVPRYQNSYRLSSYNSFNYEVADKILEEVLDGTLKGKKYNPAVCLKLCQDMSAEVRTRLHKKDFDRFKFVVTFTIFEQVGQGTNMSMGGLWDADRDMYSTRCFQSSALMAVGVPFFMSPRDEDGVAQFSAHHIKSNCLDIFTSQERASPSSKTLDESFNEAGRHF